MRAVKLDALLLYDQEKIVLDQSLPEVKHDWATSHELMHRLLEWHRPYFYGDTAQTLDPAWQKLLEGEANYGASALMFCGQVFTDEARDVTPEWASIRSLSKRNRKSLTATLRRFVEHGPKCPMAGLISTASWQKKREGQVERWRYFFMSPEFRKPFKLVDANQLLDVVDANIVRRRGGPVGDYTICLRDDDGQPHEFRAESFSNTHNILTLFTYLRKLVGNSMAVRV